MRGELEAVISRDLKDLTAYLKTGQSKKYADEKILGHWRFSVNGSLAQVRTARPEITSKEMAALRLVWRIGFAQTQVVVAPDRQVFIKNVPAPGAGALVGATPELRTLKGQWEESAGGYRMTFEGEPGVTRVSLESGRLVLAQDGQVLAFDREL
jgi:hypothetical protein